MRRFANVALACLCIAGAFASFRAYRLDRADRVAPVKFAREYTLTVRRPEVAASLDLAPTGDLAADFISDATLRDVYVPISLGGLQAPIRAAWIEAVSRQDEQTASAASLMLDAIAERPGWPYHQALLGQLVYARRSRAFSPELVTNADAWCVPLRLGARGASSDVQLWQSLALAYLQTWPDLRRRFEQDAPDVFRRAFVDADFVRSTFPQLVEAVGGSTAVALLASDPRVLRVAFDQLSDRGSMSMAWEVRQRWDAAEWQERLRDLRQIETAAAHGDENQVRQLCSRWESVHSVADFDSDAARAQAARVLEVWPSDEGTWPSDQRTTLVRFFLEGRTASIDPRILLRATQSLRNVDKPTQALLMLMAGDAAGADALAQSSDSLGSFEWTPYLVAAARYWLRNGDREKAAAALDHVLRAASDECAVLRVREALAGNVAQPPAVPVSQVWADHARLPICVTAGGHTVTFTLISGSAAIVDYGWDLVRSGSIFLAPAGQPVTVSLPKIDGFRILTATARSGTELPSIAMQVNGG